MIRTKDLYNEIKIYEDVIKQDAVSDVEFKKAMIKLSILNIKLHHNQRTNLVRIMEKMGIPKVEPRDRDEKRPEEKGK